MVRLPVCSRPEGVDEPRIVGESICRPGQFVSWPVRRRPFGTGPLTVECAELSDAVALGGTPPIGVTS